MGKKLIVLGACLVILLGLCFGAKAAAGGADDPLVSVSYLYNTILPRLESLFRQETEEGLAAQAGEYASRLDAIQPPEESPWEKANGFTALSFLDGGSVRLGPFGKFVLSEGSARLHILSGDVIDLSEGRLCAEGEELVPSERQFAA